MELKYSLDKIASSKPWLLIVLNGIEMRIQEAGYNPQLLLIVLNGIEI